MSDKRFVKTVLVVFLVSFAFGPILYPLQTSAAGTDAAVCMGANFLGAGVSYLVGLGLSALLGEVPVHDTQNDAKEYIMDVLSRCLARQILDSSVGGMLNIVRTQGR